jgi:hypothetical protein
MELMMEQPDALDYIPVIRKTGNEMFKSNGQQTGITLLDFWKWSASDLIGNAQSGILAEYIVATALGVAESVQERWAPYDLRTRSGIKVEVKSGAYIQTWYQKSFSTILLQHTSVNRLGRAYKPVEH